MRQYTQFYIDGQWVDPIQPKTLPVIDPATEQAYAEISMGSAEDVDRAVAAAQRAFETWGYTSKEERIAVLERLAVEFDKRAEEMAVATTEEMGSPIDFSRDAQIGYTRFSIDGFIDGLKHIDLEERNDPDTPGARILREPAGVVGMITPWNWPLLQVIMKVGAAMAAGCTMVLKPSEVAPISTMIFAEVMDAAGVPKGVFNLVNGDGPTVGAAISSHPAVDMVSFTGSTRAGRSVFHAAADDIKRISLELGGKSPNIIFADVPDLEATMRRACWFVFENTGQSCDAPARVLVEQSVYDQAVALAKKIANEQQVGDPKQSGHHIGPLVSDVQYGRVQALLEKGVAEGARVVAGGPGKPEGLETGYYCKPTVFADVTPEMSIFQQEIFGPALSITPFADEAEAIRLGNQTEYGLAAKLETSDMDRAHRVARRLRAGTVTINAGSTGAGAPFGGYKQSGVGRENGYLGIEDFLEAKAIGGWE